MSRCQKEHLHGAESQTKTVGQELRSSMNKVVGPGCRLMMGILSDVKGSKSFGKRNEEKWLESDNGEREEHLFHFLTLCYLRGMQTRKFAQEAARFMSGLKVTRKAIEENKTPETSPSLYIRFLGLRKRSGRKEYLAVIEIDQVIQSLWNLKIEERHVCGKDYIKAGASILEILSNTTADFYE